MRQSTTKQSTDEEAEAGNHAVVARFHGFDGEQLGVVEEFDPDSGEDDGGTKLGVEAL